MSVVSSSNCCGGNRIIYCNNSPNCRRSSDDAHRYVCTCGSAVTPLTAAATNSHRWVAAADADLQITIVMRRRLFRQNIGLRQWRLTSSIHPTPPAIGHKIFSTLLNFSERQWEFVYDMLTDNFLFSSSIHNNMTILKNAVVESRLNIKQRRNTGRWG